MPLRGAALVALLFGAACGRAEEAFHCAAPDEAALAATVVIPGGAFDAGDNRFYAEERPVLPQSVEAFSIDAAEVTNARFRDFVEATGYVTVAERALDPADFPDVPPQMLVPGSAVFVQPLSADNASPATWWRFIPGANWRHPEGPASSIEGRETHPVVHIAYEDALAYAQWRGRRLPTEAEWEYAARGGLDGAPYAWGDERPGEGAPKANIWEGVFPYANSKRDGFAGTAPVGCYPPNGYGLYDMAGNVWEWTSTPFMPRKDAEPTPAGYDPDQPGASVKTIKGGSHLCAPNFCHRFRPAARQPQETGLGASHIGFRTAGGPEG